MVTIFLVGLFFHGMNFLIQTVQLPLYPLKFLNLQLFRSAMRANQRVWGAMITWITNNFFPSQIILYGDSEKVKDNCIVIANHQLYADWWYLWIVAFCTQRHGDVKIVLKKSLKYLPIVGWAMQFWEFLFLARKWEHDQHVLNGLTSSFKKHNTPLFLVLFPEGTLVCDDKYALSQKFVKEHPEYKLYTHLLVPRTTGIMTCLRNLEGHVTTIVDVTIAYDGLKESINAERVFTMGRIFLRRDPPKRIHMLFKKYPVTPELVHNEEAFKKWLLERFDEKDQRLANFYKTGSLADKSQGITPRTLDTSIPTWDFFLICLPIFIQFTFLAWSARWLWRAVFP